MEATTKEPTMKNLNSAATGLTWGDDPKPGGTSYVIRADFTSTDVRHGDPVPVPKVMFLSNKSRKGYDAFGNHTVLNRKWTTDINDAQKFANREKAEEWFGFVAYRYAHRNPMTGTISRCYVQAVTNV